MSQSEHIAALKKVWRKASEEAIKAEEACDAARKREEEAWNAVEAALIASGAASEFLAKLIREEE